MGEMPPPYILVTLACAVVQIHLVAGFFLAAGPTFTAGDALGLLGDEAMQADDLPPSLGEWRPYSTLVVGALVTDVMLAATLVSKYRWVEA